MVNLETSYAGLSIRNPLIVSSSGLTDQVDKIVKIAEEGAGGVVLKSLFEEQIKFEAGSLMDSSDYPGAEDYLNHYVKSNNVDNYLGLIEEAKSKVDIPVIASVNCISTTEWIDFAKKIEEAGADALELNVYFIPLSKDEPCQNYEKIYLELASRMKELISIPVIMKLSNQFTNLVNLVNQLYFRGISAVVLFNRFYSPDIHIGDQKLVASEVFSSPAEIRDSLRWTAILSHFVDKIDLGASTGVHDGEAAIKLLLAGANAVHVCSSLYKNGISHIKTILKDMQDWMEKNNYSGIEDFRGQMNYGNIGDPLNYERSQFMKYYSSHH
jgi:dihydroorotate dehydrogenase (fumarate)